MASANEETYELDDGTVTDNRSEYIRQEFEKDRRRSDIAEELDVSYNIVYQATANMENAVTSKGNQKLITGEKAEELGVEDGKPRNEYIRERIEEGVTRPEVAEELDVSYNVVYAASSDMDAPDARGNVARITGEKAKELGVMNGKIRNIYCKEQYIAGKSRGEIADELDIDYQAVWRATKDIDDEDRDIEIEEDEDAGADSDTDSDGAEEDDEDNEAEELTEGMTVTDVE